MRKNRFIRRLTNEEIKMTDDEFTAWINEQIAKDAQRRAALKAEQKEITKAIQKTDSEALGRAGKLFLSGSGCEDAGKETQAAYDLLRRFFWINCELTVNCEG